MRRKFLRQNWYVNKKLGLKWRRPRGKQSKMRRSMKAKPKMPDVGYAKPAKLKYIVNGYYPVMIENVSDLQKITDKEKQAAVIRSSIGLKKAFELSEHAKRMSIKILNVRKINIAEKKIRMIKKKKEAEEKIDEKKTEVKKEEKKQEDIKQPAEQPVTHSESAGTTHHIDTPSKEIPKKQTEKKEPKAAKKEGKKKRTR